MSITTKRKYIITGAIVNTISRIMHKANISQIELAEAVFPELSQSAAASRISRILNMNSKYIDTSTLVKIAETLNENLDDFIDSDNQKDEKVADKDEKFDFSKEARDFINDAPMIDNTNKSIISIMKCIPSVSAGIGNDINGVEVFDSGDYLRVSKEIFKVPPSGTLRAIEVDGYSMVPMLLPNSWVIFEETNMITDDGLYVINRDNSLIVKLVTKDPSGAIHIESKAEGYPSWIIQPDDQTHWEIVGRVIRAII